MAGLSSIGRGTVVRGNIHGDGDLDIHGRVEGSVVVGGDLLISETGLVRSDITGRRVTVRGAVAGNVSATESLVLEQGARVVGDLGAPQVGIRPGALLRGNVSTDGPLAPAQAPAGRPASAAASRGRAAPAPAARTAPVREPARAPMRPAPAPIVQKAPPPAPAKPAVSAAAPAPAPAAPPPAAASPKAASVSHGGGSGGNTGQTSASPAPETTAAKPAPGAASSAAAGGPPPPVVPSIGKGRGSLRRGKGGGGR
jgi:cytoskeletal protein CcmA (bactofilin family)